MKSLLHPARLCPAHLLRAAGVTIAVACAAVAHAASAQSDDTLAPAFRWQSSAPLVKAPVDQAVRYHGIKDPSVVFHDGKYHLFATTASNQGWGLAYLSFKDWKDAATTPAFNLQNSGIGPGYRAAPQVYYFAPQQLWYMIFQGGDPMYSTNKDINNPAAWTAPKPFYTKTPDTMKQANGQVGWLDFWNICDDKNCYLFFTDDNGHFYRAQTRLDQFPQGFGDPQVAIQGRREDVFEASNTYKVAGTDSFITLIEAISPQGRYFRAWKSKDLAGAWEPLSDDAMNVFASAANMQFDGRVWSEGASHGELMRAGIDQTLTIDPCQPLQLLYQGLDQEKGKQYEYIELPYKLALLTARGPNAISNMCRR